MTDPVDDKPAGKPLVKAATSRRDVLKSALTAGLSFSAGAVLASHGSAAPVVTSEPMANGRSFQTPPSHIAVFEHEAKEIYKRHWLQTVETVDALKKKYEKPAFGHVKVWDMLPQLAQCIDATDRKLCNTSQLVHVQQIVWQMEKDGITDDDMYLAAILHDLGKVILLTGEEPENVVCGNKPIGEYAPGCGLDNIVFQWNHDEFIYDRLKDHLPDHLAWLLRFHSVDIEGVRPFCDDRDLAYIDDWLIPFRKYDAGTKSTHRLPPVNLLAKYQGLIEKQFPKPILF